MSLLAEMMAPVFFDFPKHHTLFIRGSSIKSAPKDSIRGKQWYYSSFAKERWTGDTNLNQPSSGSCPGEQFHTMKETDAIKCRLNDRSHHHAFSH